MWLPGRAAYGPRMGAAKRDRSCRACGKPVDRFGTCEHCGAPAWPSLDDWLLWHNWRTYLAAAALLILGVIAIGGYAVSDAGQARLFELAAVAGGPVLIIVIGWVAYRTWYRRRYPDD